MVRADDSDRRLEQAWPMTRTGDSEDISAWFQKGDSDTAKDEADDGAYGQPKCATRRDDSDK